MAEHRIRRKGVFVCCSRCHSPKLIAVEGEVSSNIHHLGLLPEKIMRCLRGFFKGNLLMSCEASSLGTEDDFPFNQFSMNLQYRICLAFKSAENSRAEAKNVLTYTKTLLMAKGHRRVKWKLGNLEISQQLKMKRHLVNLIRYLEWPSGMWNTVCL